MSGPVNEASAFLKHVLGSKLPELGVICGSGLGGLSTLVEEPVVVPYGSIPNFPQSTVEGHAGELVFGKLGGKFTVLMKGRFHFYEGYSMQKVTFPVRVMAALGVKVLMVTNAAGGINSEFEVGDLMVINDHISFPGIAGSHPLVGPNDARFGPRFPALNGVYDASLRSELIATASTLDMKPLHEGVYCCVSGPSYETPHEIGMLKLCGGDAVGMSTVPEVIVAAHCGMQVLGLSLITNRCLTPGTDLPPPTHEEVLEAVDGAKEKLLRLVLTFVERMDLRPFPRPKASKGLGNGTPFAKNQSTPAACCMSSKCCGDSISWPTVALSAGAAVLAAVAAVKFSK